MPNEYQKLMADTRLTKAELGRRLGLNRKTVSKWGDKAPQYAIAYLRLLSSAPRPWAGWSAIEPWLPDD